MAERIAGVNPEILAWARKRTGRTVAEVAQALGKKTEVIEAWEAGVDMPTYAQLETLAYSVYKRPIAIFFFPEPPDEPDPEHAFRTLPKFEIEDLLPTTRYKIREAQSFQLSLRELTGGRNPASQLIVRDLQTRPEPSTQRFADNVRSYLGVSLETQTREWRNLEDALKSWRNALEAKGVFVFKSAFRQDNVSGFCLYDPEFPIIYINNTSPVSRQIFTYFHELAHILLATNGVTKVSDRYIASLSGENREIEVFCNRFAADFLVPEAAFRVAAAQGDPRDDSFVAAIAERFRVSRESVLRRFLDAGSVTRAYYEAKAEEWREEAKKRREERREKGRGNYYATQAAYLGESYMRLAFRRYYEGSINLDQLAGHLNVSLKNVAGLEERVLNRGAA